MSLATFRNEPELAAETAVAVRTRQPGDPARSADRRRDHRRRHPEHQPDGGVPRDAAVAPGWRAGDVAARDPELRRALRGRRGGALVAVGGVVR